MYKRQGLYSFTGSAVTGGPESTSNKYLLRVGLGPDGRRHFLCWRDGASNAVACLWLGHQATNGTGAISWHRVLTPSNLLGTVSQSAGTPTGAVIERGANANGEYLRLADGTQICWKRLTLTAQDINTAYGSLYRSASLLSGNTLYAAAFLTGAPPAVTITAHVADVSVFTVVGGTGDQNNTPATVYAVYTAALTNRTTHVNVCAVGRWF